MLSEQHSAIVNLFYTSISPGWCEKMMGGLDTLVSVTSSSLSSRELMAHLTALLTFRLSYFSKSQILGFDGWRLIYCHTLTSGGGNAKSSYNIYCCTKISANTPWNSAQKGNLYYYLAKEWIWDKHFTLWLCQQMFMCTSLVVRLQWYPDQTIKIPLISS